MDIRAFGTVYGQTSRLPMCSGFVWTPADGETTFGLVGHFLLNQKYPRN